jgi:hypothetical protein
MTPEKLDELREKKEDALIISGIMFRITISIPKNCLVAIRGSVAIIKLQKFEIK